MVTAIVCIICQLPEQCIVFYFYTQVKVQFSISESHLHYNV